MKILVVDYPNAERQRTVEALAALGYTDVVVTRDGPEALAALAAGGVGLMLTEYHLRMMPGLVLVQSVRRRHPAIPILLVTSQTLATIFDAALDAGVNDTLRKPFSAADLGRKIERLTGAPGPRAPGTSDDEGGSGAAVPDG